MDNRSMNIKTSKIYFGNVMQDASDRTWQAYDASWMIIVANDHIKVVGIITEVKLLTGIGLLILMRYSNQSML